MSDIETFRSETRTWLADNCPASMRTPMPEAEIPWGGRNGQFPNPDSKLWLDRMAARGWTAPAWPVEYGGGGLSKEESQVLQRELAAIKARPALFSFGLWMLGPALLEFANEAQKQEFLPQIVRGEIRWCQGYSEPGAGSDLAGLQTKCVEDGDDYVINGQKVWTSYADQADWIFCLVRTDTTVKHEGISFILFDMTSPGIEARPIQLISGSSPFCETFFSDVRVPKKNLVGELDAGWTIAKRLLQHERASISNFGAVTGTAPVALEQVAREYVGVTGTGQLADASLRDRIAAHRMDAMGFDLTLRRAAAEAEQGSGPTAASSMFKSYGAKINQERCELLVEAMGHQAMGWRGGGFSEAELAATRQWLRSKGNSIEGGTSEINANIVAKRVLGLRDHQ
jgi:alkylation response protein AidB-like acyl-CoA dehydrogenase